MSSCRVLAIENKNAVRMNRVFLVLIFGKRLQIALFSLPHTHAQRRLLRELCKLHVCIWTLKKHFMQFFIFLNFFIFANYTTSPQHTPSSNHPSRQVLCSRKFFFSAAEPRNSSKTWWTWKKILLALGKKRILYAQGTERLYKRTLISMEHTASIDSCDYWIAMNY